MVSECLEHDPLDLYQESVIPLHEARRHSHSLERLRENSEARHSPVSEWRVTEWRVSLILPMVAMAST